MKKYLVFGLFAGILVVSMSGAWAKRPEFQVAKVTNPVTGEAKNTVTIPSTAIEMAPNIFYLGMAQDKERFVQGYAFIHYRKGFGKPSGCNEDGKCQGWEDADCVDCLNGGNGGGGNKDSSSCYGFLSKGARWENVEPYIVEATNTRGLDESFVRENMGLNIAKWEDAADGRIDGNIAKDILGNEVSGIVDGADTKSPDNKNEVLFGEIAQEGAIAITIVWGVFSGPPWARELVEWDQVYDQVDFDWLADCEAENCASKMDFENIATHELGHSIGLNDLYEDRCSEQTMYGYAGYGETRKRTLEAGDIAGTKELYK